MDYTQLILAILAGFARYGANTVKSVTDLVHGTPQKQGETDEAYIARLLTQFDAKAADTTATNKAVEADDTITATPQGDKFNVT